MKILYKKFDVNDQSRSAYICVEDTSLGLPDEAIFINYLKR